MTPRTEAALLARATSLTGHTLGSLAAHIGERLPPDLKQAKGRVGQLIETLLGARQGSQRGPDFAELGIELKTVPIGSDGGPRESTFVCTVSQPEFERLHWADSQTRAKLSRVLFIPVESKPELLLSERRVGSPLLWSPSPAQEAQLKADWEEFGELIAHGYIASITARRGRYLQLRPKGRNAQAFSWGPDPNGQPTQNPMRAFYLRRSFVRSLFDEVFLLQRG